MLRVRKPLLAFSVLIGLMSGAFQFAMLDRLVFHGATRGGDVLLYANSLWSMSQFDFHNYVRGTHVFAIHAHLLELLWVPLAWWIVPARVLCLMQASSLGLLVSLCCQAGIDLKAQTGVHTRTALAWSGLLLASLAVLGSPLVLNPYYFDPRPDLLGVPLLAWAGLRALVHQRHDRISLGLLGLAVLAREDFAILAALAVAFDPVPSPMLGRRHRLALAAAFVIYAGIFHFAFKPWLLGSAHDPSLQYHLDGKSALALSLADTILARTKIIALLVLSGGGVVVLGWRWAAPVLAGSLVLLLSNWYPSIITTTHYGMFAGAGLVVCAAAGYKAVVSRAWAGRTFAAAFALSAILYLGFSTAPFGRAFDQHAYDMQRQDGAFVFRLRGPVDLHFDRLYASLGRFAPDAAMAVGIGYAGPFAAREQILAAEEFGQALLRGQSQVTQTYPTVALFGRDRLRIGHLLVQRYEYRLAGYLGAPIDVFTRLKPHQSTRWPRVQTLSQSCLTRGLSFRGTNLLLCSLQLDAARSRATLCATGTVEPGISLELRSKTERVHLRALEGLVNLGDLRTNDCVELDGRPVSADASAVAVDRKGTSIPATQIETAEK